MPFFIISILILVSQTISFNSSRGDTVGFNELVWLFGICLLLLMSPLIVFAFVKGDGIASFGAKVGQSIVNAGMTAFSLLPFMHSSFHSGKDLAYKFGSKLKNGLNFSRFFRSGGNNFNRHGFSGSSSAAIGNPKGGIEFTNTKAVSTKINPRNSSNFGSSSKPSTPPSSSPSSPSQTNINQGARKGGALKSDQAKNGFDQRVTNKNLKTNHSNKSTGVKNQRTGNESRIDRSNSKKVMPNDRRTNNESNNRTYKVKEEAKRRQSRQGVSRRQTPSRGAIKKS